MKTAGKKYHMETGRGIQLYLGLYSSFFGIPKEKIRIV